MNHIKQRSKKRMSILAERLLAIGIILVSITIILWMWIEVAFFDYPEGYGLFIGMVAAGLQALAAKFWGILNEEEGRYL